MTTKTGLNSLKTKVDNNHLATESSINSLKTKVDGINLTKYVLKSIYGTKIGNLELKIRKVSELENKIKTAQNKPDITTFATKTEVANVENKIPSTDILLKRPIMQQK